MAESGQIILEAPGCLLIALKCVCGAPNLCAEHISLGQRARCVLIPKPISEHLGHDRARHKRMDMNFAVAIAEAEMQVAQRRLALLRVQAQAAAGEPAVQGAAGVAPVFVIEEVAPVLPAAVNEVTAPAPEEAASIAAAASVLDEALIPVVQEVAPVLAAHVAEEAATVVAVAPGPALEDIAPAADVVPMFVTGAAVNEMNVLVMEQVPPVPASDVLEEPMPMETPDPQSNDELPTTEGNDLQVGIVTTTDAATDVTAVMAENQEVEVLVGADDPAIASAALTANHNGDEQEGEGLMNTAHYIGQVMRFAGLMWSDSDVREGVDSEAASELATEMVGFEILTHKQVGRRAPIGIRSARQWPSKARLPTKIYRTVPEDNFSALVASMWRRIRTLPYRDVLRMNGRFGLIGVFRAMYQANAVDPDAEDDFRVLMIDAAEALRAMRDTTAAAQSPANTDTRTLLDVLTERNDAFTRIANDVLDRMAGPEPDVIEIDNETAAAPPKKKDSDKGNGDASGNHKSVAKRKAGRATPESNSRVAKKSKH